MSSILAYSFNASGSSSNLCANVLVVDSIKSNILSNSSLKFSLQSLTVVDIYIFNEPFEDVFFPTSASSIACLPLQSADSF